MIKVKRIPKQFLPYIIDIVYKNLKLAMLAVVANMVILYIVSIR